MNYTQEDLQFFFENANIPLSEYSHIENMIKEKEVKKVHPKEVKQRNDGRFYTYIKDDGKPRQITGVTEKEVYEKLYDFYFGFGNSTLEQLFEPWLDWLKNEIGRSGKTIKEYRRLWNKYLFDSSIIKKRVVDLTSKDFVFLFRKLTNGRNLTKKAFTNFKALPNGIMNYACEKEIIPYNCLNSINYNQFSYKAKKTKDTPLNLEELKQVSEASEENDLYDLAIKLSFYMPLRIGEIKGIMWEDINDDLIFINRQVLESKEIKDAPKGDADEGSRFIHLTKEALEILNKVKQMNPDNSFLFFRKKEPLSKCTYNRRLNSYCKKAGVKPKSSQQMRFSVASILYKSGVQATELQKMLGHTTLAMTLHYLRNVTPKEETAEKMENVLVLNEENGLHKPA